MKKRIITAAMFAACLALCTAVWPQNETTVETPALPTPPGVAATRPEVPEAPEIEEIIMPEKEKAETTELERAKEIASTATQVPVLSDVQAPHEQSATPPQELVPVPASTDTPPEKMVYVPGFGWIESQGPNQVEYAEDMYENGNKIGLMN